MNKTSISAEYRELRELGFQIFFNKSVKKLIRSLSKTFNEIYRTTVDNLEPNKVPTKFNKTLSKTFGYEAFPFHTDGAQFIIPPRWIILESVSGFSYQTATLLVDSNEFKNNPEYDKSLNQSIYFVKNSKHSFYTSIINKVLSSESIFRWNPLVMDIIEKDTVFDVNTLNAKVTRIKWMPRQTLIVDNWRMLHAREKIFEEEKQIRKLTRYNLTPVK